LLKEVVTTHQRSGFTSASAGIHADGSTECSDSGKLLIIKVLRLLVCQKEFPALCLPI
jgi:hypothetical protein